MSGRVGEESGQGCNQGSFPRAGGCRPAGQEEGVGPGGPGCCLVEGLEGQPEALGVGGVVFRNESPEIRSIEMELVSED